MVHLFALERPVLIMTPGTGERLLRFVGDKVLFSLRLAGGGAIPAPWQARLRTNLGRAAVRRHEIIAANAGGAVAAGASWRDVPMERTADGWQIELPLAEVGYFKSKAYVLDEKGWQIWPAGSDVGVSVHPDFARTANTIYCAFTRLFGLTKTLAATDDPSLEIQLTHLEALGYATLPPSGKFRDLTRQLPHIVQRLGCRIVHLLPVHPTPTTYARFGRFGSPYASLDLTAVDPALVEFDQRTTGIDQFCELTAAAHALGARVFIDIVINHTGWGSTLQENHPEYFLKNPDGRFASPGAWGTTWEDLVELEQHDASLWDLIAESLITWCRRGVDGFRCDAGYKIPVIAWQYIIARVQNEFSQTIFLLEGLGGSWEATEALLTEGGMQWAYSELFQNYTGREVAWYLDYANRQNSRVGTYVHYSETHDNNRLAAKGTAWSLLRNRLCALTSPAGGFGFTCGVEWLATEKIRVHGNTGLDWDNPVNIVAELAQLNKLISDHPCFFDGARLTRLSGPESPVYALLRQSAEGLDTVLVLLNTDPEQPQTLTLSPSLLRDIPWKVDLLGQPAPTVTAGVEGVVFTLAAGGAFCLAPTVAPVGLSGENYRRARARTAWALESLSKIIPAEAVDNLEWRWLAGQVERSPENVLTAASEFASQTARVSLQELLDQVEQQKIFPRVITWDLLDARRVTPVPPDHWLLIRDTTPFRATLKMPAGDLVHVQSIAVTDDHVACFPPRIISGQTNVPLPAPAELHLERYATVAQKLSGQIQFLAPTAVNAPPTPKPEDMVLLTNDIGGMARLCVDLGRINSKYDCVLGANLNPEVPVDRHVFVKRMRVWVNADGFLSALDFRNLAAFRAGRTPVWSFVANAGDGRTVDIELKAEMVAGQNTTVFQFSRLAVKAGQGRVLPASMEVSLTVRLDIEDRNFHSETKRNGAADFHFSSHISLLPLNNARASAGFQFTPASDRQLKAFANAGEYHPQAEWCENIPHPVEQTRGQQGSGDAYSPGWFELPLKPDAAVQLTITAEK